MSYKETLDWLFSQLPMYQRSGALAYKSDIGNIVEACNHLNNPHLKFKSVHIAGTNGKGSTAHMLASTFQEAGYKTGLYTSPHLKDFRERIKINGLMIKKEQVIHFIEENKSFFSSIDMSFFEMTVALAFHQFAEEKVDIAIIETGLGGRLDSTNIIKPELSVITNISWDHKNLLGDTLEKIAFEKAGIIKDNVDVVIGRKQSEVKYVFSQVAKEKKATMHYAKSYDYETKLAGNYQKENINTACTSIDILKEKGWKISDLDIKKGLLNVYKNTDFRGRWEKLCSSPIVVCDTGHNIEGIKEIVNQLNEIEYQQLHIVFGMVEDKDVGNILSLLPKSAKYYFCSPNIARALPVRTLYKEAQKQGIKGRVFSSVIEALENAKSTAGEHDFIFVGGSTFVVSEIL